MFKILFYIFFNLSFADVNYSLDSYFYTQKNQLADSIINPVNQIFKTPNNEFYLDLRGELKWRTATQQMIVRPRLTDYIKNIQASNQTQQESKAQVDLTDAFYEQYWTSSISSTIGLQVYQWGPAEFINSSNPLYHFNSRQKSVVYKEKGQVLIRTNLSANKENSFVFIFQPTSNNESEWIADDKFTPKVLLKYEKSWTKTANYLGLVAGTEEKTNVFIGEYFNYSLTDGFSIYADMKQAQNRLNFIPEDNGTFLNLVPENQIKNQWPTLGVFGIRWEDNYDIRLEYIYNGMGFSKNDLNSTIVSASNILNPSYGQNLKRFLKPGLEILGQNYLYASYRINEPFKFKEFNFYLRYMKSLQDESFLVQFEFDKAVYDSFLIFSNLSFVSGAIDSEFRLINDWQALVGIKWGI